MAIASDGEAFPVPDGLARQFLSEYGDFPLFLINRALRCKQTTTYTLYPLRALQVNDFYESSVFLFFFSSWGLGLAGAC